MHKASVTLQIIFCIRKFVLKVFFPLSETNHDEPNLKSYDPIFKACIQIPSWNVCKLLCLQTNYVCVTFLILNCISLGSHIIKCVITIIHLPTPDML